MIEKIKFEKLPLEVIEKLRPPIPEFIEVYRAKGMFDPSKIDYLLVAEMSIFDDCWRCRGYVYNGTEPDFSEWGAFGIDMAKTQRVW